MVPACPKNRPGRCPAAGDRAKKQSITFTSNGDGATVMRVITPYLASRIFTAPIARAVTRCRKDGAGAGWVIDMKSDSAKVDRMEMLMLGGSLRCKFSCSFSSATVSTGTRRPVRAVVMSLEYHGGN
jgi:hypothetical protein